MCWFFFLNFFFKGKKIYEQWTLLQFDFLWLFCVAVWPASTQRKRVIYTPFRPTVTFFNTVWIPFDLASTCKPFANLGQRVPSLVNSNFCPLFFIMCCSYLAEVPCYSCTCVGSLLRENLFACDWILKHIHGFKAGDSTSSVDPLCTLLLLIGILVKAEVMSRCQSICNAISNKDSHSSCHAPQAKIEGGCDIRAYS